MSSETEFLHNSKKCIFRNMTDFENHQKPQDKTNLYDFLDLGLEGHTLQSLFSLCYNLIVCLKLNCWDLFDVCAFLRVIA